MGFMVCGRLVQVATQPPCAGSCKEGKYPEENPGKLQPEDARKLYKGRPDRLAELFTALSQPRFRLSHLGRRSCRLLSQSNPGRCRLGLRWRLGCLGCRSGRRVRGCRRVHRRHKRLGGSASPKSQRTSEANRIHTTKCSLSVYFRKTPSTEKRNPSLLHPILTTANTARMRGRKDEEFSLDGWRILCSGDRASYLEPGTNPAYSGAGSQSRNSMG